MKPHTIAQGYNPSTQEVEEERSEIQGHPQLSSEFEATLG